ncbi:MAG TPA: CPBP family intramembrane glutamic endopeptidase [Steroidobacteraceae bacterium]|nr:CPBP family intramembrane glutamic endopeptidase [Steroidobacteraceae bacterium]
MRAFAWFLGMFVVGFAVMAVLTYPAWLLVHPYVDWPFHRIGGRIGQLVLLVCLVLVARHLHIADRASWGYGLPRRAFLRELVRALGLGIATMVPIVVVIALLGVREWKGGVAPDAAMLAKLTLKGFATGMAVALIEETFLRGAMFTAIARESGAKLAIVLTALVYAATHFFLSAKIPADQVNAWSGLDLVTGTLKAFSDPLGLANPHAAIVDAYLCLFAVGVLLAAVRAATGHIAACMGLHAGWVWVITFVRETSQPVENHPLRFLVSQFDGLVGWLVLAWTVVIGLVLYRVYARRKAAGVTLPLGG